eukprot:12685465-Ditylum_brightwellii.AAC.1
MQDDLTGFDLVAGYYIDDDGEQCNFKMLHIVSKAVDPSANQNGEAFGIDCGYFTSPNKPSVPPPNSFSQALPPMNFAQGAPPPQSIPPQAPHHWNFAR